MSNPTAAQLKEEGNALFAKKQFNDAHGKYSAAIKAGGDNAVLYANRAAYLDAADDAGKATELDPNYSKAWGRLATAYREMGSWSKCIDAWKKALETLPLSNLSPSELKQKRQYIASLSEAEARWEDMQNVNGNMQRVNDGAGQNKFPWERAKAMYEDLARAKMSRVTSSAWVIASAYEDFAEGINALNKVHIPMQNGEPIPGPATGTLGGLESLTNGVLRDKRVFHIGIPDFIEKYNNQVMFESTARKAWVDGGPDLVMQKAQARLRTAGWSDVRPALSVTVRAWIMRGFLADGLTRDPRSAETWYKNTITLLERGRRVWRDVPKTDRGAVFDQSFLRGVKALRLEAFMSSYNESRNDYPLNSLSKLCDALIADAESERTDPTVEVDPGFISSFYVYPVGHALATKGFCEMETARRHSTSLDDMKAHLTQAAELYVAAARKFPEDDELRCWFLQSAVGAYWKCGPPLRVTLPLITEIKQCMPKMKTIWENSQLAMGGRDKALQKTVWFEEDVTKALAKGKCTLDDPIVMGDPDDPNNLA